MALISQIKSTDNATPYNVRDDVHFWGGRNLIWNTIHPVAAYWAFTRGSIDGEYIKITPTTSGGYAKTKVTYLDYTDTIGKIYTVSWEAKSTGDTTNYTAAPNMGIYFGYSAAARVNNIFSSSYDRYIGLTIASTVPETWTHYFYTFNAVDSLFTTGIEETLTAGSQLSLQFAVGKSRMPLHIRNVKLELGNKPTDWSPAPEDIAHVNGECLELLS